MPDTEDILARLEALRTADLPTHGGRTLAYVYDSGLAGVDEVAMRAMKSYAATNGLDPTAFPSLRRMENDLVGWAANLLNGPPGTVGTVTSGGTESILLAVQAARDAHPDVVTPRIVLPATAHAAFHKAAHYFRVEPVLVAVDPATLRADPDAMADAIDEATVLVVASAPSYAHGVIDPIPEVAAAAADRGVRCHVDACIGGWVLPYLRRDGVEVAPFDFALEGVTSVSVDLHKYAYAPKGVSVLLHRDAGLRRAHFFAGASWPGYTMLNTTTQSTKSGGPLAAAWAVLQLIGHDGYRRLARDAYDATRWLAAELAEGHGPRPVAEPESTLLALTAGDDWDVFTLADEMAERGWLVQPQLRFHGMPATVHLTLSAATASDVGELRDALRSATAAAVAHGPVRVPAELADAARHLDPATLDEERFDELVGMAGLGDVATAGLPRRMAPINALLDSAPPPVREALLTAFLDRLMRPNR